MTRKLGALGLALTAVLAMAAVAASTASAAGEKFHCEKEPCVLTATSEAGTKAEFTSGETSIACTAHYKATGATKTVESITVLAEYTTGTCNLNTHVRMNHCDYLFTSTTTAGKAPVHVQCSGGSKIEVEITDLGCTLKFGEQTPTGGVKYTNLADGTVTAESEFTGITFEKVGGFGCVFIGNTGGYKAKDIVTCYEDNGPKPVAGTEGTTVVYTDNNVKVKCFHE